MKKRQPDRWERMVSKYADRAMKDYTAFVLADHEVVELLRNEHKKVVRMVKKHQALWGERILPLDAKNEFGRHCRLAQCQEILDQLTEKGK